MFNAALIAHGIHLEYVFEGNLERTGQAVKSARGNVIAPNGFKGNRKCIAVYEIEGKEKTYETPAYDDITIKNSPLWHGDPDQQLAYYAARGWARRHRPDIIMGAYSKEEVEEMSERKVRNVTPENEQAGFAKLANKAREEAKPVADTEGSTGAAAESSADQIVDVQEVAQTDEGQQEAPDIREPDITSSAYRRGQEAATDLMFSLDQCPFKDEPDQAQDWEAGFLSVRPQEAAE